MICTHSGFSFLLLKLESKQTQTESTTSKRIEVHYETVRGLHIVKLR